LLNCLARDNALFSMSRHLAINSNGDLMPQIWMTYGELADLMECSPKRASDYGRQEGLDRKASRDGKTRVKLNLTLMELFVSRIRGASTQPLDQAIEDLRDVHARMRAYEGQDQSAVGDATELSALAAKSA
jgi:hypothetical protein